MKGGDGEKRKGGEGQNRRCFGGKRKGKFWKRLMSGKRE